MKQYFVLLSLVCFIFLFYPSDAHAYLNPGSGSDFFQMIMSFFAGIFAAIKVFWNKITGLFGKKKEKDYE